MTRCELQVYAERKNRSVVEAARAMLEEKIMPKFYWADSVRTAAYIHNQIGEKVSAHELYFGRKPNLRRLMLFGSIAYVQVPEGSWTPSRRSVYWSATHMNKRVISVIAPGPNKFE